MGKRLCFAALALLIPAAVQAQGLESLLSSIEEANEDKLNPVAEHPPLTAPPLLAPVGLPLQQASTICPALQKAVVAATGAESGVWSITVANADGMVLADLHGNKSRIPASNQKLISTAIAMDRLGPQPPNQHRALALAQWHVPASKAVVTPPLALVDCGALPSWPLALEADLQPAQAL